MKPTRVAVAFALGWLTVATACGAGGQDDSPTPTAAPSGGASSPAAVTDGSLQIRSGGRLHYVCLGEGSPAIILEGADAGTRSFPSRFLDPLAAVTTVCAYDRLGLGSSSSSPNHVRDLDEVCEVEDELIAGLRLPAPYILMGQSAGGNMVIWCAARHPRNVAALVTIDAYHDSPAMMKEEDEGWQGSADHVDFVRATIQLDRMRVPIGDFPVLVFSATQADPGGVQNQRYWLGLSPHSRQVVVEGGHNLHQEVPDALTPEIIDLLAAIRETSSTQ